MSDKPQFPATLRTRTLETLEALGGITETEQCLGNLMGTFENKAAAPDLAEDKKKTLLDAAKTLGNVSFLLTHIRLDLEITEAVAAIFTSDSFRGDSAPGDKEDELAWRFARPKPLLPATDDVLTEAAKIAKGDETLSMQVELLQKFYNDVRMAFHIKNQGLLGRPWSRDGAA